MAQRNKNQPPKWNDVYRKLAEKLCLIGGKSSKQGSELYKQCITNTKFKDCNKWIEKFDSIWGTTSLDPIHIFASLNNNKLSYKKRLERINILFEILDENFKEGYTDINFDGCPNLMTMKVIGARNKNTQKEVWEIFHKVMKQSQKAKIDFEKIQKWYGMSTGVFTIFLFWIDARNFIPLDKNTQALLETYNKLNTFPTQYKTYTNLLIKEPANLYLLLALVSYDNKKQKLLTSEDKQRLCNYLNTTLPIYSAKHLKLISIRPLKDCNVKYLKTLKEDELYIFNKAYKIQDNTIEVDAKQDISLYNTDNTKVNINAIVGKNGTGKSTIVELLFAIIHNISVIKEINPNIQKIEDISVELIFESLHLYKIVLEKGKCSIYKFKERNNQYIQEEQPTNIENFELNKLFYTIAINYSHHSLNSLYMGEWIYNILHKNDAYQTPIVIEPYRKNGNIDINRQDNLAKQRLLTNLLLPEDPDDIKNSPRQLTEFYKAESLKLSFNLKKIFYKTDNIARISGECIYKDEKTTLTYMSFKNIYIKTLNKLYKQYDVKETPSKDLHNDDFDTFTFDDKVHLYIFKKLLTIAIRYKTYSGYFDGKGGFINPDEYIEKIYKDKSHITYKLNQAINFLKFKNKTPIESIEYSQQHTIEAISNAIENIKYEYSNTQMHLSTNELQPPSFFDVDIILDNDIHFNTLSSGEKQKIYSVNSILYHLNNIDSVDSALNSTDSADSALIQYSNVNIVLDEIELYFHPELQRNYLSHLHHAISKANTNNILGINIIFVTHSPFILSDIPDSKILFLEKDSSDINAKTIASKKEIKTFGANIHELLINGFFMNNSIGEYALKKIQDIVEFHHQVTHSEADIEALNKKYQILKDEFYFIQEHIGEEYMSRVIENHIEYIEKKFNDDSFRSKRIEILEQKLDELINNNNA